MEESESDESEWAPLDVTPDFAVHLERLGRRVDAAMKRLAPRARIAEHPWLAIGVASAAGAAVALAPLLVHARAKRQQRVERTLVDAALAVFGSVAARLVREYAIAGVASAARRLWSHRE
jgi:hypothetical protein